MHTDYAIDNTLFKCALYIRLSREDGDDLESESVINQKALLHEYLKRNRLSFVDEYIDDGYSGGNFNRPGFKKLIEDIESGLINCVITKDLSRLGRDHIDTGRYIERYFPENNIRYIAVNDGIDTFDETKDDDMMPFKLSINDVYAKDISKKVRSVKYSQMREGKFASGTVSYGYKKDPNNKYHLIIDEEYAPVVKRIFNLYISGVGVSSIAHILTSEGIKTPVLVKNYKSYIDKSNHPEIWKDKSVNNILRNPVYTGDLVQHRHQNISHKTKKRRTLSEDKWIITENAHEAIISKETFELAKRIRNKSNHYDKHHIRNEYILKDLVFCKDCGKRMCISNDKRRGRIIMNCSTYRRFSKYHICTSKFMNYKKLEETVLERLKELASKYNKDKLEFENILKKEYKSPKKELENKIKIVNNEIEVLRKKQDSLYDDKFEGLINSDTYKRLYNKVYEQIESLNKKLINYKKELKDLSKVQNEYSDIISIINSFLNMENPTKEMIHKIIDKIYITHDKRVEIHYKIKEEV